MQNLQLVWTYEHTVVDISHDMQFGHRKVVIVSDKGIDFSTQIKIMLCPLSGHYVKLAGPKLTNSHIE